MGFDALVVGEKQHLLTGWFTKGAKDGDFSDFRPWKDAVYTEQRQWLDWHGCRYAIECKPCLSDDYPAVLRQMQTACRVAVANRANVGEMVLLAGSFKSSAITLEQAKAFFRLSRINLVTVDEVEVAQLV